MSGWLKRRTFSRILVHTRDDQTIRGVLHSVARDGLVLVNAEYVENEGSVSLAGYTFIPKERVSFVQKPEV